ncbi:hypothetical protein ACWDTR_14085 [Streptomyces sp. NPDC003470]
MAATTEHRSPLQTMRQLRQLRRIRAFYAAGLCLWAVSAAWTGWKSPGSRQMWASALLLGVFTGLLLLATLWLRRLEHAAPGRPVHHAAPRTAGAAQHAG